MPAKVVTVFHPRGGVCPGQATRYTCGRRLCPTQRTPGRRTTGAHIPPAYLPQDMCLRDQIRPGPRHAWWLRGGRSAGIHRRPEEVLLSGNALVGTERSRRWRAGGGTPSQSPGRHVPVSPGSPVCLSSFLWHPTSLICAVPTFSRFGYLCGCVPVWWACPR